MFSHRGDQRTLTHNISIASLLSFVAGLVNVIGFLSIYRLTTNVTGHFAFFIDELFQFNFIKAFVFFLYIFFFFLGSFLSNFLIEIRLKSNESNTHITAVLLECLILSVSGIFGMRIIANYPDVLAFLLLFSMGLQNSLVTTISNSIVRTTHLTGLFTDLGIELSQLFFYKSAEQKFKLYSSIKLRFTIIAFFFIGGVIGGLLYSKVNLYGLILGSLVLVCGLFFDVVQLKKSEKSHR